MRYCATPMKYCATTRHCTIISSSEIDDRSNSCVTQLEHVTQNVTQLKTPPTAKLLQNPTPNKSCDTISQLRHTPSQIYPNSWKFQNLGPTPAPARNSWSCVPDTMCRAQDLRTTSSFRIIFWPPLRHNTLNPQKCL